MCFKEEKEDTFKPTENTNHIIIMIIEYIDDIIRMEFLQNDSPQLEGTDIEELNTNN